MARYLRSLSQSYGLRTLLRQAVRTAEGVFEGSLAVKSSPVTVVLSETGGAASGAGTEVEGEDHLGGIGPARRIAIWACR